MNVAIRADASSEIGTGHVMRCLTLADALTRLGKARVVFISRDLPGNLNGLIESKGFEVLRLPGTGTYSDDAELSGDTLDRIALSHGEIDWLVVDSYALDARWEIALRGRARNVLAIDDLADRPHYCDALLDQNQPDVTRYAALVPKSCRMMLGPRYALIRDEFREARKTMHSRDGKIRRLMVFFGGADFTGETEKTVEALKALDFSVAADVVVGSSNTRKESIKDMCKGVPGLEYHCQVDNMAYLMARADLAVGAGGTSTWERCCVGLPAIVTSVAKNQESLARTLDKEGAVSYLGLAGSVTAEDIAVRIKTLAEKPEMLLKMSVKAYGMVDGSGADRVGKVMEDLSHESTTNKTEQPL